MSWAEDLRKSTATLIWKSWLACPNPIKARFRSVYALARVKELVSQSTRFHVDHNLFYDRQYYLSLEKWSRIGVEVMAETIRREFSPRSVVDVGCGSGLLLEALAKFGISVTGLENSDAALHLCRSRGLQVIKLDLERTFRMNLKSDLVVSTEVAEHLPESCAEKFVDLLTGIAPDVVFTAATPGQGGDDHANEQPHCYWINKFAQRGFSRDERRENRMKSEWASKKVASWYHANLMILRQSRSSSADSSPKSCNG